jgi:hypothetical protein
MVKKLEGIWLHFMIILSLWLIYTSSGSLTFYCGIFFWLYYMIRLYVYRESKSF